MGEVAVAAFGFNESTWRLQPWRYYAETAAHLNDLDSHTGYIISIDGPSTRSGWEKVAGVDVYRAGPSTVGKILGRPLADVVDDLSPDHLVWPVDQFTVGYSGFLRRITVPITGIYPGLWYTQSDLQPLSPREMIANRDLTGSRVLMALLPDRVSGHPFDGGHFTNIITFSTHTKDRLVRKTGLDETDVMPVMPGLDRSDFQSPGSTAFENAKMARNHDETGTNLLYMGAPLSIRGLDTILDAMALVEPDTVELTILSRRHVDPDTGEDHYAGHENWIRNRCGGLGIRDSVTIVPGFLPREQVRAHISLSDVVCLPFKILQADMPLSILEVMAQGRVPIGTTVGGIPELIDHGERGLLVEPASSRELTNAIELLDADPDLREELAGNAHAYAHTDHPSWEVVGERVQEIITADD